MLGPPSSWMSAPTGSSGTPCVSIARSGRSSMAWGRQCARKLECAGGRREWGQWPPRGRGAPCAFRADAPRSGPELKHHVRGCRAPAGGGEYIYVPTTLVAFEHRARVFKFRNRTSARKLHHRFTNTERNLESRCAAARPPRTQKLLTIGGWPPHLRNCTAPCVQNSSITFVQ